METDSTSTATERALYSNSLEPTRVTTARFIWFGGGRSSSVVCLRRSAWMT